MMSNLSRDVLALKPRKILHPDVWDENDQLDDKVRKRLHKIAYEFYVFLGVAVPMTDVIFTGSLSNYNYSEMSDIDLHVLLDFSKISSNQDLVRDFLAAKKSVWNNKHNITISGHEVELYAQDKDEVHHSTGVYSILYDRWLIKPSQGSQSVNYGAVKIKANDLMSEIDAILRQPNRMPKIEKMKEKIRRLRQCGLEEAGEYSVENLAFKILRRNGYMEKLYDAYDQDYDEFFSIESLKKRNTL